MSNRSNEVTLIGNTGGTPEIKYIGRKKTPMCTVNLATNQYRNENGERKKETQWHRLVFWGNLAQVVDKYVNSGDSITVWGKIIYRSYQDKNGIDRNITEIICSDLYMHSTKESKATSEESYPQESNNQQPSDEDDLPF